MEYASSKQHIRLSGKAHWQRKFNFKSYIMAGGHIKEYMFGQQDKKYPQKVST